MARLAEFVHGRALSIAQLPWQRGTLMGKELAVIMCVSGILAGSLGIVSEPPDDVKALVAEMRSSLPQVLAASFAASHDSTQQKRFAFEGRTGAFLYASEHMVVLRTRDGKDFIAVSEGGRMPPGELQPPRPLGYETEIDTFASILDEVFPLLAIEDAASKKEGFESVTKAADDWRLVSRYVGGSRSIGKNSKLAQFNPMRSVTLNIASDGFLLSRQVEGLEAERYERPDPMPMHRRFVTDHMDWKVIEVKAARSEDWTFDVPEAKRVLDGILTVASRTVLVDRTRTDVSESGVKTTAATVGIEPVPNVEGRAPAWRTPLLITGGLLVVVGLAAAIRRRAEGGV